MGRKTVLLDDLDGTELPDDTQPIYLSLGRTKYALYLTESNHDKLLKAVGPFIENAETVANTPSSSTPASSKASDADRERNAKIRHWAIDTGFKYENAKGEMVTLGDRGRIPDVVAKAWEDAGSPDIS